MLFSDHYLIPSNLARSDRRHVLALAASLTARDIVSRPGPVRAATVAAENEDGSSLALNTAGNLLDSQTGNGDTGGGSSGRATVLVILLDDDTVLGDVGQLDVGEGHVRDVTGGLVDGLNADAVVRVGHGGVGDGHVLHDVVVAQANGSDGETVAAGAVAAGEHNVLMDSRVSLVVVEVFFDCLPRQS
jgi:hypothetical protein